MLVHFFNIQIQRWPMRAQIYCIIANTSHYNYERDVILLNAYCSIINSNVEVVDKQLEKHSKHNATSYV